MRWSYKKERTKDPKWLQPAFMDPPPPAKYFPHNAPNTFAYAGLETGVAGLPPLPRQQGIALGGGHQVLCERGFLLPSFRGTMQLSSGGSGRQS